jgi:hypothetical protein
MSMNQTGIESVSHAPNELSNDSVPGMVGRRRAYIRQDVTKLLSDRGVINDDTSLSSLQHKVSEVRMIIIETVTHAQRNSLASLVFRRGVGRRASSRARTQVRHEGAIFVDIRVQSPYRNIMISSRRSESAEESTDIVQRWSTLLRNAAQHIPPSW